MTILERISQAADEHFARTATHPRFVIIGEPSYAELWENVDLLPEHRRRNCDCVNEAFGMQVVRPGYNAITIE